MQKNRIELAGYLADKPQVRYMPSGTPVANVRMAEGYRYTDRNNETQEHTNWHNLVFYGELADIAVSYEKGENIFVEGTLQARKFTPKDGSPRTIHEVIARSVYLIAKSRAGKEAPGDNAPQREEASIAPINVVEDGEADVWPS
ncbi:single-stranded DNA-binding protein [Bryobacter aggregatus]|uniref:single-stranded DNA-binding protein n=1 Tax=Bryobacter aggregatus TaxID=360054 RepID=UPI00068E3C01|nr:single-stranded DNA-binding protein [Bryobacter aggregatus]